MGSKEWDISLGLFMFCLEFNVYAGYCMSLLLAPVSIYARILIARHYKIKRLLPVSIIRFSTLGLLLAAPASCFMGSRYFKYFFIPFYFILATALDYIFTRIFLRTCPKRNIFFMILLSNLVVMALVVLAYFAVQIFVILL